ncbi:MAG TPA: hypothetical protein VHX62_09015, partial [Solirubrobacteraceae bacterium]|nr:hypothetical protein [Solirubrobacteraceae bacterium]
PRDPSEGDSVSTTTLSEAVIRVLGQSASISRDDLAAELSDASKEALSRVIKRAIDDQRVRELADGQLEVATAPLVGGGSRR